MQLTQFIRTNWWLISLIAVGVSACGIAWSYLALFWGAPAISSGRRVALKMLRMANVQPGDTVIDLGAGTGRIVILAARKFKAHAIGVEIDPLRCLIANAKIRLLGLQESAHVNLGNLFDVDVSHADVVTLFLLQQTNQKLIGKFSEQLKAGARVVSHTYSISAWVPEGLDDRLGIFLYEIGNTTAPVTRFL